MFAEQVILVTGASSGIGAALARQLAAKQGRCVLVARRRDRLEALVAEIESAGRPRPVPLVADLLEPGAPQRVVEEVHSRLGPIDVLVNNAGVGFVGPFVKHSAPQLEQMLGLNVGALVKLTHLVLPGMIQRRRGWIMNVASAAAYQPMGNMATYAATKAFVLSFSEGLWAEVRRKGVTVTSVNPGTTRTEFFDHQGWSPMREKLLKGAMSADRVAQIAIKALAKGKPSVTCGLGNKLAVGLGQLLPRATVARITAKMMKPVN
ncbi:MAG: SDR family NAD(P)-dependent oxidoreductase [Phycisphaerae bacterium]